MRENENNRRIFAGAAAIATIAALAMSGTAMAAMADTASATDACTLYAQWSDDACPAPLASTGANTGVAALAALGAVGGAGLLIASRRRAAKAPQTDDKD